MFRRLKFAFKKPERTPEQDCRDFGHIAMFTQWSELYWFGVECRCYRCGVLVECPTDGSQPVIAKG